MKKIEAELPCHLQLVHTEVRLVSAMDGKLLGLWPFKCIRRYKFVGNLFSIEAGRKAPTGEGIFEFISNECSEIYRVMDTIIRTKAGNTTMRRFASEKVHNQIEQGHLPVRKANSVPVSPIKEVQYDYAAPLQSTTSKPNPPPIPLHSPPKLPTPQPEPAYDILSPGTDSPDGVSKVTKQGVTPSNGNQYNTLRFDKTRPVETRSPVLPRATEMSSSPGSYDTLRFVDDASNKDDTLKAQGQYDTLQFGGRNDTSPSVMNSVQSTKNGLDDNELRNSSGSFYDTLDHSSGSFGSINSTSSNTYDSINTRSRPQSGEADTYDCLSSTKQEIKPQPPNTLDLANNTYDALHTESQKPAGKSSPVTVHKPTTTSQGIGPPPNKPPPRKKPPSIPKHPEILARKISAGQVQKPNIPDVPARKISSEVKPDKPIKAPRKKTVAKEADQTRKAESISDVLQKRLANQPPEDDGSYASVDHEYTRIDYSTVSNPGVADSSGIYAEPDENDIWASPIPKPVQAKPAKPARHNPKPTKTFFKKTAHPKPVGDSAEGGKFADELRKKLENKLKKKGHKAGQSDSDAQPNTYETIYDEVDDQHGPYYSEPDPYSEPAV